MYLLPAIDIRGGRCVRLLQGDYDRETVYGDDPVAMAMRFEAEGAPWIHVVDLDAARTGMATNREVVIRIAQAVSVPVQAGGGIRTFSDATALLAGGVSRVVLGTAAVEDPDLVGLLVKRHPGTVAVGLDVRDGEVALRGWTEGSGRTLQEAVTSLAPLGPSVFVVTEIGRDGMQTGPDLVMYEKLVGETEVPIVASGGVGVLGDLTALGALTAEGRRLEGVVVGKAIYERAFTVAEGVEACGA